MSGQISYTSYDYKPVDIVPVVASFDSDGHVKPLWVRIGTSAYKVVSSWRQNSMYSNIITYNCKLQDNDYLRPLAITYHPKECVWTIDKITVSN